MSSETARGRGEMFVLSAPSGAGKTTLIRRMFESHPVLRQTLGFAVSHTTRRPRRGEVDGVDYHFVDRAVFEERVEAGHFLEWATVHGRLYGTSYEAVEQLLDRGIDVLLDIDVQGAEQVCRKHPEVPTLFIMPPSFEALEDRLRGRGSEAAEEISRRLSAAPGEVRQALAYEYVIVNDRVEHACEALAAVFLAHRCRRERMNDRLRQIIDDFPARAEGSESHDPGGSR